MEEIRTGVNVAEIFGKNVFNDTVMQERLPKKIYKELKKEKSSILQRQTSLLTR